MTEISSIFSVITSWLWDIVCVLQTYNGLVTAVATIAIGCFTWALARVSKTQARLTRESFKLTRELFDAEQRPWLSVKKPRIHVRHDREEVCVSLLTTNCGKSVASNVEFRLDVKRVQMPDVLDARSRNFCSAAQTSGGKWEKKYVIIPKAPVNVFASAPVEPPTKDQQSFEVNFCIIYTGDGIGRVLRTGGQLTFSDGLIGEPDAEGWSEVSPRKHNFRVTYAD